MREYDVEFFIKENGDCPVREFLLSIDKKMRSKILMEIDLLEENGPQLREPYSKHLNDGIFEIRAKQGNKYYPRALFLFCWEEDCSYEWIYQENSESTSI